MSEAKPPAIRPTRMRARELKTFDDRQKAEAPPGLDEIVTDRDSGKLVDRPRQPIVAIHIKDGLFKKFVITLVFFFACKAIDTLIFRFKFLLQVLLWACALLLSYLGWEVKPPQEVTEAGRAIYQRLFGSLPPSILPHRDETSLRQELDRRVAEAEALKARIAADAKEKADKAAAEVAKAREEAQARIEEARLAAERAAEEAKRQLSLAATLASYARGIQSVVGPFRNGIESFFEGVSGRIADLRGRMAVNAEKRELEEAIKGYAKEQEIAKDKVRRAQMRAVTAKKKAQNAQALAEIDRALAIQLRQIQEENARIERAKQVELNRAITARPGVILKSVTPINRRR